MSAMYRDLTDLIDVHNVKALNITKESNPAFLFQNCLNVIESRADPQILLMISEQCMVGLAFLYSTFLSKSL